MSGFAKKSDSASAGNAKPKLLSDDNPWVQHHRNWNITMKTWGIFLVGLLLIVVGLFFNLVSAPRYEKFLTFAITTAACASICFIYCLRSWKWPLTVAAIVFLVPTVFVILDSASRLALNRRMFDLIN